MSDPSRWLDPSSDAPRGVRDLLAHAPKAPALSADAKARMATRIAQGAAAAGGVAAGTWLWKGLFGATAIGLAGVVFVLATQTHAPSPPPIRPTTAVAPPIESTTVAELAPAPVETAPLRTAEAEAPSAVPQAVPAARTTTAPARAAAASAHAAPAADDAGDDLDLVQRAHGLVDSDPGAALNLTRQHASRFPHSLYDQERERIAIRALANLGRTQEARARGEAFLRNYPRSIYATPVRDLLRTLQ
jgi:hypothetical protein